MDHKLARICWNDNGWTRPSGTQGKTKNKSAYEVITGFGAEEWLFDTSKIINGYHYAFVQAIGAHRDKYRGSTFHLSLYAIDNRTRQRWWLGTINNVSVVDEDDSASVYALYEEYGWLDEMRSQIVAVGANDEAFQEYATPENFAVVKFRVEDLALLDKPLEFAYGDPAVTSDYYNLKRYIQEPAFPALSAEFLFRAGHNPPTDKQRLEYDRHDRDVNNHHNQVQAQLFLNLCKLHGNENVGTENHTGAGSRVDLVVRKGEKYVLYEIKTGPSLKSCVREALGQLLEYRHAIGDAKIAKLVVVTPHTPDEGIERYLGALRTEHSLPIYYEQCIA